MFGSASAISQRLKSLEKHVRDENPVLLEAVNSFREIDRVAYRMGLLEREQSYAMQIPWWPLISVLGTFSSGKSTFINHYLGFRLQSTGNQAVDDKFTVICHSREDTVHVLPGLALDADPRFPFYQISEEIDKVAGGEGRRIDAYLQLKTCPGEQLRGKILIDSPGFDADAQRTSTLRITEYIINLSDLVIVFFDARHPEPGAMQDTLEHLVAGSIGRADSNKFLYVLNQIDTTAREDNPEEVFGAWQRALAQKGLTAGRFYTIYNPDAAVPIEDDRLRLRFENKRDADLRAINDRGSRCRDCRPCLASRNHQAYDSKERVAWTARLIIHDRIQQVEVERSYRIIGALEKTARSIETRLVPLLSEAIARWRRRTLLLDGTVFGLLALFVLFLFAQFGSWEGVLPDMPGFLNVVENPAVALSSLVTLTAAAGYLHYRLRMIGARSAGKWLAARAGDPLERQSLMGAFARSTSIWHSLYNLQPVGWGRSSRRKLHKVINDTDRFVQRLNDAFANPSGPGNPDIMAAFGDKKQRRESVESHSDTPRD